MTPSWIAPIFQATNCSEARPVSVLPTYRIQGIRVFCVPGCIKSRCATTSLTALLTAGALLTTSSHRSRFLLEDADPSWLAVHILIDDGGPLHPLGLLGRVQAAASREGVELCRSSAGATSWNYLDFHGNVIVGRFFVNSMAMGKLQRRDQAASLLILSLSYLLIYCKYWPCDHSDSLFGAA